MTITSKTFCKILLMTFFLNFDSAFSYTFLGGTDESRLNASRDQPEVVFVWNGLAPRISGRDAFQDIDASLGDAEYFAALLQKVVGIWNNVDGSFINIVIETSNDITKNTNDGIHSITLDTVNLSAAAYAVPNIDGEWINDCDIVIGDRSVAADSLAFILLHELGHCLGLGHNHTEYRSVMGYSKQTRSLKLSLDYRMGLSHLYPSDPDASLEQNYGCGQVAGVKPYHLALWYLIPLLWIGIMGQSGKKQKSTRGET